MDKITNWAINAAENLAGRLLVWSACKRIKRDQQGDRHEVHHIMAALKVGTTDNCDYTCPLHLKDPDPISIAKMVLIMKREKMTDEN